MPKAVAELPNREETIVAYLRHAALGPGDDEHVWASEAVDDFVRSAEPRAGWELVLELLRRASDDEVGLVVAGPLEDLVCRHGTSLADEIEQRAATDESFRWALGGIWLSKGELPDAVLDRIVQASGGAIKPLPPLAELEPPSRPDT